MSNKHFEEEYIPGIVKIGKFTGWIGVLIIFAPVFVVTFIFGIIPDQQPLWIALIAQLSVNVVWWFVEPISYFPILGIPGTYISFLSGNVSNLRIPCGVAAQKAVGVQPGTEEGTVVSTIGVCASVFVNILLLIIGVIIGTSVLSKLPQNIITTLNFLLPALFGAVFAQFAIDDVKSAVVAIVLGIGSLLMYKAGMFDWVPIDPSIATILLPIFGTVLIARILYKKNALNKG